MLDDNFNIDDLSPELYLSKRDAILDNYQTAINMPIAEDYIYENLYKIMGKLLQKLAVRSSPKELQRQEQYN
jgi:hypothetical protein